MHVVALFISMPVTILSYTRLCNLLNASSCGDSMNHFATALARLRMVTESAVGGWLWAGWSCPALTDTYPLGSAKEVSHGGTKWAVSVRVQAEGSNSRAGTIVSRQLERQLIIRQYYGFPILILSRLAQPTIDVSQPLVHFIECHDLHIS